MNLIYKLNVSWKFCIFLLLVNVSLYAEQLCSNPVCIDPNSVKSNEFTNSTTTESEQPNKEEKQQFKISSSHKKKHAIAKKAAVGAFGCIAIPLMYHFILQEKTPNLKETIPQNVELQDFSLQTFFGQSILNHGRYCPPQISDKSFENLMKTFRQMCMNNTFNSLARPCFYVQKQVIDPGSRIAIIGDIHGDFDAVYEIFSKMHKIGFLDESFKIKDNNFVVFLGDYVDRGARSKEVLTLLVGFKIINWNKVFLCMGNHEHPSCKEAGYNGYNLLQEYDLYKCLPVSLFLGFPGHWYQFSHGAPCGYEPTFLNSEVTIRFIQDNQQIRHMLWDEFGAQASGLRSCWGINYTIQKISDYLARCKIFGLFGGHIHCYDVPDGEYGLKLLHKGASRQEVSQTMRIMQQCEWRKVFDPNNNIIQLADIQNSGSIPVFILHTSKSNGINLKYRYSFCILNFGLSFEASQIQVLEEAK